MLSGQGLDLVLYRADVTHVTMLTLSEQLARAYAEKLAGNWPECPIPAPVQE
jgi:hypothetical protein